MVLRPRWAASLLLVLMATAVAAQQQSLTIADIFGYEGWRRFNGNPEASMSWASSSNPWLDDTHFLWPGDGDGRWLRVDAATGASTPLYSARQVETALAEIGVAASSASEAARRRPSIFSEDRGSFVLTIETDLFAFDLATGTASRLTRSREPKSEVTFSPDGRSVAFVAGNNLHVARWTRPASGSRPVESISVVALTSDGSDSRLNGKLDWVYAEELYGRGRYRAYWWSPDSSHIAFIQLDEASVPEYTLLDDISYHPELTRWAYPKAGDPNPAARLGVVAAAGGPVRWIDTSRYSDFLIVNAGWTPDGLAVIYQIQNREQTWLDLNRAAVGTGEVTTLLRESGKAWVERWQDSSADPVWLNDGSFLWLSERSGWRHIYRYSASGSLMRQVTSGDWEARRIHGLDASQTTVFLDATAHTPVGLDVYRVGLDGAGLRRLSQQDGRHRAFFNPSRTLFLDSWNDVSTPPQVRLHRANGETVRVVNDNVVSALREYRLSKPEFLQVKARDGFVMEAMMIKPPDFDPSRRYPVYQFAYAGPHLQQVVNGWDSLDFMYHQLLAQHGIIVWMMDNRTSSGKGMQSAWPAYRNLGATELRDIEDGIAWLRRQPYVDASRIGIAGVSYGGYMTLYALTHSTSFAMGIAEGAVSDWRNYDTIYTERYMGLPDDNADGYRRSSPRFSAAALSGQLLLIHSALDDNVHPQNTMQFAYELQKAGKPFQMMIYPRSSHGVGDPGLAMHMRQMMLDFTKKSLLP
jgi:dipeptidyl-peptidase-4